MTISSVANKTGRKFKGNEVESSCFLFHEFISVQEYIYPKKTDKAKTIKSENYTGRYFQGASRQWQKDKG